MCLSKLGAKTLLIDGDLITGSLGFNAGIEDAEVGMLDLLSGKETDVGKTVVESFGGVHIIPSGPLSLRSFVRSKVENLPEIARMISEKYDIVLIDSPPGIHKVGIAVLKASDEVILVTTPDQISISGTIATKITASVLKKRVFGSVINRSSKGFFRRTLGMKESEVKAALGTKILGMIPEDLNIYKSTLKGKPVVVYKPRSSSSKSFEKIAKNIIQLKG